MVTVLGAAHYGIIRTMYHEALTVHLLAFLLIELRKISIHVSLSVYVLSVACLHVACRSSRSGLTDELTDVLAVLVGQPLGPRRYSSRRSSMMLLSKAANFMKVEHDHTGSRNTVQLIKTELSKAYLYRTLSCEDSDSDSIYCLANVYLAVLYYATGQYQTAIDHCTLVTRSQDHSQCSSHVVQGEILPKTDDDIDIVLGLGVFYQHVRTAALNQQQQTHVTVFTTELFAHYMHIKCLSFTKCQQLSDVSNSQSSTYEIQSYVMYITDAQLLFIADVLLWKLVIGFSGLNIVYKQQYCRRQNSPNYPSELNTSVLVELLQKSALEHLTTYRQLEARDFGSLATVVTTDFEALYAYESSEYRQCFHLSTQNVHTLLYASRVVVSVFIFPEFIQLLDDDIVSLAALIQIIDPECRNDCRSVCINQITLSLYLMTQCQLKLRHSVTSLAHTLDYIKVARRRCPVEWILNRLVLKMIAHKTVTCITTMIN